MVEHRIERRRLAAAGRAGDQDDSFWARDHPLEFAKLRFGEPQSGERNQPFLAVEDAQDDVFAVDRRLRRGAKIDLSAAHIERDASVLRRARLGDVHPAHHLDAHRHRWPVRLVQRAHLAQRAVDAVADAQKTGFRLEVDVGRFALDGVGEDGVDQPNDRLSVFVGRRLHGAEIDFAGFDLVQDAVDRQLVPVSLVDCAVDLGFAGEQRIDLDRFGRPAANLVERDEVIDVGERERQSATLIVVGERQQVVAFGQRVRHQRQRRRVNDGVGQVDALLAQAFGERVAQRRLGDETKRNE